MNEFDFHIWSMGSKVYLIDHLTADELYHRYRAEQEPIKRTHLQIVWLLTSGRPATVAAEMTGYSQRWISVLVGRYNEAGVDGLGDRSQGRGICRRVSSSRRSAGSKNQPRNIARPCASPARARSRSPDVSISEMSCCLVGLG